MHYPRTVSSLLLCVAVAVYVITRKCFVFIVRVGFQEGAVWLHFISLLLTKIITPLTDYRNY